MPQLDHDLLYFLNHTLASDWLDSVMTILTNVRWWLPVYIIASILLIRNHGWSGVRMVIGVAVLVGVANIMTNVLLKEWLARPRPCAIASNGLPLVEWIRIPSGMRHGYSLPSSHAVNNFCAAMFFVTLFPTRKVMVILFTLAAIVALTRPYLGLHYPSDTLIGAMFGMGLGYIFAKMFTKIERRYFVIE